MMKWNFITHKYENYSVPSNWHTPLIAEMDEIINCAGCGKEIVYGYSYVSMAIHNEIGFGYPICESCMRKELETRKNAEKDANKKSMFGSS